MAKDIKNLQGQDKIDFQDIINEYADVWASNSSVVTITANTIISDTHINKILQVSSSSNVYLTLGNTNPVGSSILVDQVGSGRVVFTANDVSIVNRYNFDRTSGQNAVMSAYVRSANTWVLTGDGSTV